MTSTPENHHVFCGRGAELTALVEAFEAVRAGQGPRRVRITGEAGRGKTRLALKLYEHLSEHHDPYGYWPPGHAVLADPLRPAPDLGDLAVRAHFASFTNDERALQFLWWGFRLALPDGGVRCGLETHRRSLAPHLRRLDRGLGNTEGQAKLQRRGEEIAKELAIEGLGFALDAIPGALTLRTVVQRVWEGWREREQARRDEEASRASTVAADEARSGDDLLSRTLDALARVLTATETHPTAVPTVVFCDDAHFARTGGDEGAQRLMETLWQRAVARRWPLLLLTTEATGDGPGSDGGAAPSDERTVVLSLDALPHPDLAPLVAAACPGLPQSDVDFLLAKTEGCPEALKQLLRHIADAPAWINAGALTRAARKKIEALPGNLGALIAERLKAAPLDVQRALAISSVQGGQFLRQLTLETSARIDGEPAAQALAQAESPHGMVQAVDLHTSSFRRRAHRDASRARLDAVLAQNEREVEALTWQAATAFLDDAARTAASEAALLRGMHGVVATLGERSGDDRMRQRAAGSLLFLVRACEDPALAASWATRFASVVLEGDVQRPPVELHGFPLDDLHAAMEALAAWRGPGAAADLSRAVLNEARRRAAVAGTPEAASAVLRASRVAAHAHAGARRWTSAVALFEELLEQVRTRADGPAASIEPVRDAGSVHDALLDLAECCLEAGPRWTRRALGAIGEIRLPRTAPQPSSADGGPADGSDALVSTHERLAALHRRIAEWGGAGVDADEHSGLALEHSRAALDRSARRSSAAWTVHSGQVAAHAQRMARKGDWRAVTDLVAAEHERLGSRFQSGFVGSRWTGVLLDLAEAAAEAGASDAARALCDVVERSPRSADLRGDPASRLLAVRRRIDPDCAAQPGGECDLADAPDCATPPLQLDARLRELRARYRASAQPDGELIDDLIEGLAAAARRAWSLVQWERARRLLAECATIEAALHAQIGTVAHDRFQATDHLLSQADEMLSGGETESALVVIEQALRHAVDTGTEHSNVYKRAGRLARLANRPVQRREWAEAALRCARREVEQSRDRCDAASLMPLLYEAGVLAGQGGDWPSAEARHTELLDIGLQVSRGAGRDVWVASAAASLLSRAVQRADVPSSRRLVKLLIHVAAEHAHERPGPGTASLDALLVRAVRQLEKLEPALAGELQALRDASKALKAAFAEALELDAARDAAWSAVPEAER